MIVHAEAQVHEAESPLGDANKQLRLMHVEQRLTRDFAQCVSTDVVQCVCKPLRRHWASRASLRSCRSWSSEVLVVASWLGQRLRVLF